MFLRMCCGRASDTRSRSHEGSQGHQQRRRTHTRGLASILRDVHGNGATGQTSQRIVNVEFSSVKRPCFPSGFGLLVFSRDGSQSCSISHTDVPSCSMLACFAVMRFTAFAQDALTIR